MKMTDPTVFIGPPEAIAALEAAAFTVTVDLDDVEGMPSHAELLAMLREAADMLRPERFDRYAHDEVEPFVERIDAIPAPHAPRRIVHSFLGTFGADHDLEDAIALVRRANRIAWAPSLFEHELAVEVTDDDGRTRVYQFDVQAPKGVGSR